jgi:branched-chain amino acid transport system permease protein
MFNQLLLNGIIAGSIYALIALGFTVIYKTVRFFHFAHGVVYTAGAYFAYSLSMSLGFNQLLSFFLPRSLPQFSA